MISNAATEMALTGAEAKSICKLGQLENCCAFLVLGSDGFSCIRLNPHFSTTIFNRLEKGTMNAKGRGGWPGCFCEEELKND